MDLQLELTREHTSRVHDIQQSYNRELAREYERFWAVSLWYGFGRIPYDTEVQRTGPIMTVIQGRCVSRYDFSVPEEPRKL